MPTTPMPDHRARDAIAIAVIIPAHRQPGLLAEAIRSVLVQEGGPPAAAVVVDDGCPSGLSHMTFS
jgi:glycosyltransferase involved in cell wall biosynthesis